MRKSKATYLKRIEAGGKYGAVEKTLRELELNTVCRSARCPNRTECYRKGTATFLIMGPSCTRNCLYCSVEKRKPASLDPSEPLRVAQAVAKLNLSYVVITSTTRDDLDDGGLNHFIETVKAIKNTSPRTEIEVLVPDFSGKWERLSDLINSGVSVFNHNIEVVRRLFNNYRPLADYNRSLELLKKVSLEFNIPVKSGFMVGLGETLDEIKETFIDLKNSNVDIVVVGQYLRPTRNHPEPKKVYNKNEFDEIKKMAQEIGFKRSFIDPYARSSFNAFEIRKELGVISEA
ncbi:MAG: lipoyl synthase [Actinobacteria bacterium]|nr:lipoyl synthase [Actinomycetota bacterium]